MIKLSIPAADFRVLLIQLVLRLVHRLSKTLQPHTKRAELVDDLLESTLKLERELKRCVTLDVTRVHKRVLWDALFSNRLPEWLQVDLMDCLREEEVKVSNSHAVTEYLEALEESPLLRCIPPVEEPKEDLKEVPHDELEGGTHYIEIDDGDFEERMTIIFTNDRGQIDLCDGGQHYQRGYDFCTYYELPKGINFDGPVVYARPEHLVEPKEELKEVQWDQLDPNRWYLEFNPDGEVAYLLLGRHWIGPQGDEWSKYLVYSNNYFTYFELPEGFEL